MVDINEVKLKGGINKMKENIAVLKFILETNLISCLFLFFVVVPLQFFFHLTPAGSENIMMDNILY